MHRADEVTFRKREACPDFETLLAFESGGLAPLAHEQAAAHLRACDFCRASSHMLSKHTPSGEPPPSEERIPLALWMVAQALLPNGEGAQPAHLERAA